MSSSINYTDLVTAPLALPPTRWASRQGPTTATPTQTERDALVKARATKSAQIIRAVHQGCQRARQVLAQHRSRP